MWDVNSTVTKNWDYLFWKDTPVHHLTHASEFLCIKTPLFLKEISNKARKYSLRRATNVTFSKYRGWRRKKMNRTLRSFFKQIDLLVHLGPKILKSCLLHWWICVRRDSNMCATWFVHILCEWWWDGAWRAGGTSDMTCLWLLRICGWLQLNATHCNSMQHATGRWNVLSVAGRLKIAFIIAHKRNNVVVLFGTLKVQSFMLTEVRDCDLLIVVTSSTFLKRKDMWREKCSWPRSSKPAAQHIYRQMYFVHLYGLHVYCAFVDLGSSGSPGVSPTPGLTSSTQVVCVCVRAYTSTHTHTTLTPAKIEKYTRHTHYLYPCQNIASHASNKR